MGQEGRGEKPTYWLGRDEAAARLLISQSRLLDPFTGSFLREAGVSEGMRVLDVGSGAGNVALLAADLVGPAGAVVGVDTNPQILEVARGRADSAGLTNASFVAGDVRSLELEGDFDAVVGRLVLMFVADPAGTLRSLLGLLRPGGVVAFQESKLAPEPIETWPPLPTWRAFGGWWLESARHAGLNTRMGYGLRQTFLEAGLPEPAMHLWAPVGGGPDWEGYDWAASAVGSLLPLVVASGAATEEEVGIGTLARRLREETVASGGVVKGPDLVGAWARTP